MVNAIKVNFIKLLSSLDCDGSKEMQTDYKAMLNKLKDPNYEFPAKHKQWMSVVLASLFCALPKPAFPMNDKNKKLIEDFSKKHIETPANQYDNRAKKV